MADLLGVVLVGALVGGAVVGAFALGALLYIVARIMIEFLIML
jgi:hypothetical protein